jgi:hypothetical protein
MEGWQTADTLKERVLDFLHCHYVLELPGLLEDNAVVMHAITDWFDSSPGIVDIVELDNLMDEIEGETKGRKLAASRTQNVRDLLTFFVAKKVVSSFDLAAIYLIRSNRRAST